MSQITISALGLAAVKISNGEKNIYVDSIINFQKHPLNPCDYSDADILLITHDHDDHYHAKEIATVAKETNAVIVGPPSITYSMFVDYQINPSQLKILYDQDPGVPVKAKIGHIEMSSFASRHFHDGDNMTIHNSYLIEIDKKKIYVTGDSYIITEKDQRLYHLDVMIPNIVFFDKKKEHLSILEEMSKKYSPKNIVPVHLIDCDWTIQIDDIKEEVLRRKLDRVMVLDKNHSMISV